MSRQPRVPIAAATPHGTYKIIPSDHQAVDLAKLERLEVEVEVRRTCGDAIHQLLNEERDRSRFIVADVRGRMNCDWNSELPTLPFDQLAKRPVEELRAANVHPADVARALESERRAALIEAQRVKLVGDVAALATLVRRLREHAGTAQPSGAIFAVRSATGFKD